MAPQKKSLSDVAGYAAGLVAMIACLVFVFLMYKTGLSKTAVKALSVCFVASIVNYALSSSGYNIQPSSLSMKKIN
jgi:predicted membrane channel-forming protein YqfA (hemolysin III family)